MRLSAVTSYGTRLGTHRANEKYYSANHSTNKKKNNYCGLKETDNRSGRPFPHKSQFNGTFPNSYALILCVEFIPSRYWQFVLNFLRA